MDNFMAALICLLIIGVGGILLVMIRRLTRVEKSVVALREADIVQTTAIEELRGRVTDRIITTVELKKALSDAVGPMYARLEVQDKVLDGIKDLLVQHFKDK